MRILMTAAIAIMLSTPVLAADWTWSKEDTVREVVGLGLTVIDYGQTMDLATREDRVELNPILGPHPSRENVRDYFLAVLVLHPLISLALPAEADIFGYKAKPRMAWQYFYIGVEVTATASNYNGGLRLKF
jgi:hypothetical protein